MAPVVSTKNINIGVPQRISSPNSSIMVIVLLVVICGLSVFFIILPKQSALAVKKGQLQQLTDQEKKISGEVATFNGLVGNLQANPEAVKELDEALPLDGKTFNLQILLQGFADSSGVTVQSINLSGSSGVLAGDTSLLADPYSATRTLKKIQGQVNIVGTFPQMLAFLQKVENSDRIMQVTSLSIASSKNNNLSLSLSFNAYYFAP